MESASAPNMQSTRGSSYASEEIEMRRTPSERELDQLRQLTHRMTMDQLQRAAQEQQEIASRRNSRAPTPTQVLLDIDGGHQTVKGHRVRMLPSRSLLTFLLHAIILTAVLVTSLIMVIKTNATEQFWIGLLSLSVGGFFPNPKFKSPKINVPLPPSQEEEA